MAVIVGCGLIYVPPERTRKEFTPKELRELEDDIEATGLIHPITIHKDPEGPRYSLQAGERRWKAISGLHQAKRSFRYGDETVPLGYIPATVITNRTPLDLLQLEISENLKRVDLSWQERTDALARLHKLRVASNPEQTPTDTGREISEIMEVSPKYGATAVTRSLLLAEHKDDPVVQKAKSESEAWTALQQKLSTSFRVALEENVKKELAHETSRPVDDPFLEEPPLLEGLPGGTNHSVLRVVPAPRSTRHTLIHGDALDILPGLPSNSFSVMIADPPYGIGADNMTRQKTARHHYDDSPERAYKVAKGILEKAHHCLADESCVFMFCVPTLWTALYDLLPDLGYSPWHRPLIWKKSMEGLAPWGNKGFTYTYEMILFATKGKRGLNDGHVDILDFPRSQRNKLHGAQKPVTLYEFLLRRSSYAGDLCIDPCCGSGTIFPAANRSGLTAYGIEEQTIYHNIAKSRMMDDHVREAPEPDDEFEPGDGGPDDEVNGYPSVSDDFDIDFGEPVQGDSGLETFEGPDHWRDLE